MRDKTYFNNILKIIIVPMLLILFSAIVGSIRVSFITDAEFEALAGGFKGFFEYVPVGNKELFISSFKKLFFIWLLISVSGTFLPAFAINALTLCERGYVIGYTSAGFFRVYGVKGILAGVALIPEMLLFIPVLLVFSSISLKMSFFRYDNKKLFLKKYVFYVIFFLTVFCVVSLFQTFVTTIFMNAVAKVM